MRRLLLPFVLLLGACVPVTEGNTPSRAVIADSTLPPMKTFGRAEIFRPPLDNATLVQDFLDLSFQLESGRPLPVLTRFEGPISLRVTGAPPPTLAADLGLLLARLRTEAGIDIRTTTRPEASITIEAVSRADIRRVLPQAACFVVPNVGSLREYRGARRNPRTNWAQLTTRDRIAIFVPRDASPQETRDCLHEELAQALGPLNDLYRLPNSVFNDDNVHTVLTHFDMLMLRATYAPELRSGMSRSQVAERLPAIFARLNPAGQTGPRPRAAPTPQAWREAIQTALGPRSGEAARRTAARQAVAIAEQQGWRDSRRGFAHYALGRALQGTDPVAARRQYLVADGFYARSASTRLHRAYVATQLAAYDLAAGDGPAALRRIAPHLGPARAAQNASLLATLQLMRAEALDLTGRQAEASSVRLDSLGWARYGFGPDWAVRAKQREIATLTPQNPPA
ncbi:DUF2927 domain-containing protein [Roseobacter sp. WL0113]|uniref:DUF2927 domain-containing protein n=2 Tax=Roseobacter sinensis TaxID=2931391 RepID=A0ABT3BCZ2_9RHOB|nr:DUF2927 domain-containing protein [Roseobacter sp. WL0113]MCV3271019.1 DUF2927 domain-containing protein [Roseobacter sp. WL0113]